MKVTVSGAEPEVVLAPRAALVVRKPSEAEIKMTATTITATMLPATIFFECSLKSKQESERKMELREKIDIGLAVLIFSLLAIDVLDVISTFAGFKLGLSEINPIAFSLLQSFGNSGLWLLKGISLGIIVTTVFIVVKSHPVYDDEAALVALSVVNFVGVAVLWNNFALLH